MKEQLADWDCAIDFIKKSARKNAFGISQIFIQQIYEKYRKTNLLCSLPKGYISICQCNNKVCEAIPKATIKEYNCGHFGTYLEDFFEQAIKDYINFFDKNSK